MGQGEVSTDVATPDAGAILRAAVGEGPVRGAQLEHQQLALGSLLSEDGWWQWWWGRRAGLKLYPLGKCWEDF